MGKPTISMAIFNSDVNLPEGKQKTLWLEWMVLKATALGIYPAE